MVGYVTERNITADTIGTKIKLTTKRKVVLKAVHLTKLDDQTER